jgi:hypothetical protein
MVTLPYWLQKRGAKAEEVDQRTWRIHATALPPCEISVFPMPAGPAWRVAVSLISDKGRTSLAHTESPFENEMAAWNAGFELYRKRIEE